ncbi:MAG: hypothetical protein J0L86_05565 [Flavobacteriales bacterium]|nr:hypothetical protein [Flavobacteriales bacterium]
MKKRIIGFFFIFVLKSFAQTSKTTIGLMPFTSTVSKNKILTAEIQDIVLESLNTKNNITTIDRSKDDFLNKELDLQINERSIASKKLVEQGKKMGADQLIVGTVISFESVRKKGSSGVIGGLIDDKSGYYYESTIVFSLQIIDVETGKIVSQKTFKQTNEDKSILGNDDSKDESKNKAIASSKAAIVVWLNEIYAPKIKILKVEERTKSGKPKTILVTGIDNSLAVGKKLILEETELIEIEKGKEPLKRTKKVATLTITEKQGDITVCKVTDGENTIEDKITTKNTLTIKEN